MQLLELPASIFKPELQPFMAAVFRHILEDPATLQVGGCWVCGRMRVGGRGQGRRSAIL